MSDNLISEIFHTTPPITRILGLMIITIAFLAYTEILSSYRIMFSLNPLRLISSFLYFGPLTIDCLISMIFFLRYSKMLEESFLSLSDFLYFNIVVVISISVVAYLMDLTILGPIFSSVFTYVWTRKNPTVQIQLMGCIVFPAFYLPFVLPVFSFFTERKFLRNEIIGIIIGHLYYFMKFVMPNFDCDPLQTPKFLRRIFKEIMPTEAVAIVGDVAEVDDDNDVVGDVTDVVEVANDGVFGEVTDDGNINVSVNSFDLTETSRIMGNLSEHNSSAVIGESTSYETKSCIDSSNLITDSFMGNNEESKGFSSSLVISDNHTDEETSWGEGSSQINDF